jgi:hypothetical protein
VHPGWGCCNLHSRFVACKKPGLHECDWGACSCLGCQFGSIIIHGAISDVRFSHEPFIATPVRAPV